MEKIYYNAIKIIQSNLILSHPEEEAGGEPFLKGSSVGTSDHYLRCPLSQLSTSCWHYHSHFYCTKFTTNSISAQLKTCLFYGAIALCAEGIRWNIIRDKLSYALHPVVHFSE